MKKPARDEEIIKDFLVAAALHKLDLVRHYIEEIGLHPDATRRAKPTALCYSVLKPHHGLMRYLLNKGASTNHLDGIGMTPLHYAAMGGCLYCVAYLVGHGARINIENRMGKTPVAMTLGKPHLSQCQELLERHGASLFESEPGFRRFH